MSGEMALPEFLNARLAEDEGRAQFLAQEFRRQYGSESMEGACADAIVRHCRVMRRIVEREHSTRGDVTANLVDMAGMYTWHPDHRAAWLHAYIQAQGQKP